jgi:hypothetical protein
MKATWFCNLLTSFNPEPAATVLEEVVKSEKCKVKTEKWSKAPSARLFFNSHFSLYTFHFSLIFLQPSPLAPG